MIIACSIKAGEEECPVRPHNTLGHPGSSAGIQKENIVLVPLELRDEHALAALSMITAVIPGTVWCELAPDRTSLLLHVFDLGSEAEFVAGFKALYEHPLKEIFE